MMRCDGFAASLLFAALAAALWIPVASIGAPLLGGPGALALYLSAVTVLYGSAIAPRGHRRVRSAAALGAAALSVAALAQNGSELALGLALLLGLTRGAFLYPRSAARALFIEALLLGGGLLFARFLAGPSALSMAVALWGFLLVQSVFFLIGGARPTTDAARGDPFDNAHRRAMTLLES